MIGPTKKKMPSKKVCTGCEMLISKELGGTFRFPKTWIANYCSHEGQKTHEMDVSFIKRGIPYTPEWCPVRGI